MRAILLSIFVLSGCVSAQQAKTFYRRETAPWVGCPEERVVIRDERRDDLAGRHNWTAVCQGGRTYYCVREEYGRGTRCNPAD